MVNSGATASFSRGSTAGFTSGFELVESAATPHPGFLHTDNNSQNRDRSAIVERVTVKPRKSLASFPHRRPCDSPAAAMSTQGKALGSRRSSTLRPGNNKFSATEWLRGQPVISAPPIIAYAGMHAAAGVHQPPRSTALGVGRDPLACAMVFFAIFCWGPLKAAGTLRASSLREAYPERFLPPEV